MEAIEHLSSKIVSVYDYVKHSYFTLFIIFALIVSIAYVSYSHLGSSSESSDLMDSTDSYDSTNLYNTESSNVSSVSNIFVSLSSFGALHFFISFLVTILILWVIVHLIKYMFGVNIIHIIQTIFSNKNLNNAIDNVDDKFEYVEDTVFGFFKDNDKKMDNNSSNVSINDLHSTGTTGTTGTSNKIVNTNDSQDRPSEVFNVSNNKYTFNDSKSICSAYNSRLATYKEVEDSYNDGGEWCNYGWSQDQLALFPTQQKTYDKLQKIKGHENDCGRPGVNGGFMGNPELTFGVNCYGVKPKKGKKEETIMAETQIYPKTKNDIDLEKRVKYWKKNIDSVNVSAFNHDTWNRI
jgi:hypothetical protein